jgi:predicted site-specific integrase-resolvase
MAQKRYRLTEAARLLNMSPWTLRRWVYAGRAPSIKTETGRVYIPAWWVEEQSGEKPPSSHIRCALYAREASSENRTALTAQLNGLRQYAGAKGYQIVHEVSEIGSGINDQRPKLHTLLKKRDFDVLLVEHKERLTRFGFRWLEALCPFTIEVMNLAENGRDDLLEDLVAILTAFSARLYGQRRGREKTQAAIRALKGESA